MHTSEAQLRRSPPIPLVSQSERGSGSVVTSMRTTIYGALTRCGAAMYYLRQRASPAWAETRTSRGSVVTLAFERHDSTRSRLPSGREAPHPKRSANGSFAVSWKYNVTRRRSRIAISRSDYFVQLNQWIERDACIECVISIYQIDIFQLLKRHSARVFYLNVNNFVFSARNCPIIYT
jgi:hypothetical protein